MPATFLTQYFIKIDGSDAPQELMADILEVVVDTSLYLPEMFTLLIRDDVPPDTNKLKWIDNTSLFDLGKTVEISAKPSEQIGSNGSSSSKTLLIKGEIAALEPNFSETGGTTLLVRGYNKSHRLHRGKKSRTFLNQTDSDIVKKIAGEVGLSPQVDITTLRYDYVIQSNQTNMEFLQERAGRLGYQAFAAEDKLYFKKGEAKLGDGPELKRTEGLRSFGPVLAATHQVDKIKVQSWDPKQKKAITGQATPNSKMNQGGIGKTGGAAAKVFGAAEAIVVNQPVSTPDEAKALAQGLADDLSSEFIQAEGVCLGHPQVKAGYVITISGVGKRFSGKYFVTSAIHTFNQEGYETYFSISGRQPNTIKHLLDLNDSAGPGLNGRSQTTGVAPALVTNNKDPENLGRVKVELPWLGEGIETDWMRITSPGAAGEGGGRGMFFLPEVGDEVLVGFEFGNLHRPYVIGGLWNSKDKPPVSNSEAVGGDGKVNQRIIKSRSGHIILLDDTQGKEQIVIRDKTGKNEIVIDSASNTMTIKLTKDYVLDNKGKSDVKSVGDVTIDSKGNITINSTGNTQIKSTGNLDLQATGMLNIKGNKVSIDGGPMTEVKGATVSVSGSALTEVKGALVKIN